ncbi:adenosylhomocysteinase [Streptomyces nigrescens]
METFERARLDAYFAKIAAQFAPTDQATSFLVTHLLAERPGFVRAVAAMSRLRAVLPKPKSITPTAQREVERAIPVDTLSRELFADPDAALDYFESRAAGEPVVLLDVGGYFAPALAELHSRFSGRILGVIEDTENGHRRYKDLDKLPCPVISVARSPQALSQGFTVARDREDALRGAGLVLCATGAISLHGEDFGHLRNGAYVATVTSSEDELELSNLPDVYTRTTVGDHVTRYQTTGHYFYLANGGNAVNFLHGASVGPFIFLVQAEILAGIRLLTRTDLAPGMHEASADDRAAIAATWLSYFNR